jgi:hypothetical protein
MSLPREQERPTASDAAARTLILHMVVLHALTSPPRDMLAQMMGGWSQKDRDEFADEAKKRAEEAWERLGSVRAQMSPQEREFAGSTMLTMTQQQQVDGMWRMESLQVLIWALGRLPKLPSFDTQADEGTLRSYAPEGAEAFLKEARLRPAEEIDRMRDAAELWHWRSRTRQLVEMGDQLKPTPAMIASGLRTYDDIVRVAAEQAAKDGVAATVDADFAVRGKPYRALTAEEWSEIRSITMERHFALNWLCGYAPGNRWDDTPTDT